MHSLQPPRRFDRHWCGWWKCERGWLPEALLQPGLPESDRNVDLELAHRSRHCATAAQFGIFKFIVSIIRRVGWGFFKIKSRDLRFKSLLRTDMCIPCWEMSSVAISLYIYERAGRFNSPLLGNWNRKAKDRETGSRTTRITLHLFVHGELWWVCLSLKFQQFPSLHTDTGFWLGWSSARRNVIHRSRPYAGRFLNGYRLFIFCSFIVTQRTLWLFLNNSLMFIIFPYVQHYEAVVLCPILLLCALINNSMGVALTPLYFV